jgi:Zn-dependent protease with chaperone function
LLLLAALCGATGPTVVYCLSPAQDRSPAAHRALLTADLQQLQSQAAGHGREANSAEAVPQHYTLTADQRARAEAYARTRYVVYFTGTLLALVVCLLFWLGRFGVALRNLVRRVSCRLIVKCLIFAPLFIAAFSVLSLPFDYYSGYRIEHQFNLSTQTAASWFADWGKSLALSMVAAIVLIWVFYGVVRRSPRRWWFYFWLATIPLELFVMFIEPWVVEPLFYKFTPLAQTEPGLTERIEDMMRRAGLQIPPSRIFEMNASSKTKTLNAYVSGLGSSKRVVVWDTTLTALTPDETLLVLGHETGHYALHHIPKEFALIELVLLILFYMGFRAFKLLVLRLGPRTALEGEGDLASLPLALLVLALLSFIGSPAFDAISRHYEHQADQYGLELAYGVVPDPNAAAARAEQALGVLDLADPDPSPLIVFWLYTHPPVEDRIRFENAYHPWTEGRPMELVHPHS